MTLTVKVLNEAQSTEREKNQRINRLIKILAAGIPIATGISGLAAGIATFLATPSSANLAAALTDEEGTGAVALETNATWTPALAFGGGTTGITYSAQTGSYIKVGRVLFWNLHILLTSKGSSTGSATITGFPFTGVQDAGLGQLVFASGLSTASGLFAIANGATTVALRLPAAAGTTPAADTNFTNTSEFFMAGWTRCTT
jgi:hypothetical protein